MRNTSLVYAIFFMAQPALADINTLDPLWVACPKGLVAVEAAFQEINKKIAPEVSKLSGDELVRMIQANPPSAFGQVLVYVWPDLLVKRMANVEGFMTCASYLFEIRMSIRDKKQIDFERKISQYRACNESATAGNTPEIVKRVSNCLLEAAWATSASVKK